MALVSLLQKQVESRARQVCSQRNQSLPTEMGKACFESLQEGVCFYKEHFLLDSNHCLYESLVARVKWDAEQQTWQLSIPETETNSEKSSVESWQPYPYLPNSQDLTAIMREVSKDPKAMFWNRDS